MLRPVLTFFDRFTTQSRNPTRLIDLRNVCGSFLVCGILFGVEVLAAPPNPPVIIGDDVIIAENNANRINAILGGYTVPSILSGLQYPADPVTTTTHEVRNNAELASAVRGDGRLIRVYGPGNGGQSTYNQFDLGGRSDIDIVMDNDATIAGGGGWAWWGAVRRIRWTGGNINITSSSGEGFTIADTEDTLFDDLRIYRSTSGGHIFYPGPTRNRRFAIINSTVEFISSGSGIYYAVYSSGNPINRGDWIFLNNRFIGESSAARIMDLGLRTAIVANYFSEFPNPASFRIHEECDKLWFANNMVVSGGANQPSISFLVSGSAADNSKILNDFLVENNRLFATQGNIGPGNVMRFGDSQVSNQDQMIGLVARNNLWSDPTGPTVGVSHGWYQNISQPYIAENNLRVGPGHPSYETPPAASAFGANR